MPLILGAASAVATGFSINNSCRFNDGDSAFMKKTFVAGDQDKWTFSCWIKKAAVALDMYMLACYDDNSNYTSLYFEAPSGNLTFANNISGSYVGKLATSSLLRDPAAWYNIVAVYDSGNGVAGDRMKLYVNGVEETSFAVDTNPSLNEDSIGNKLNAECIIGQKGDAGVYLDGYMAEAVFLDGTAAAATSFGEFDEDSPTIWKPIDVSELTFGTNGFHLDFKDSANLGNDANGGTDFTETNLAAVDQSQDSPTNNFATFNPLQNYYPGSTFSNGNNTIVTGASPRYAPNQSTIGLVSGKWYWETKCTDGSTDSWTQGVQSSFTTSTSNAVGDNANDYSYFANGQTFTAGSGSSYGDTYGIDDIIGNYLDLDNNKIYWAKNGTVQNSGTGISITAVASTLKGAYFPAVSDWSSAATYTYHLNFGNGCFGDTAVTSAVADANGYGLFEYDPSAGTFDSASKNFLAICTKNLGSDGG